MFLGDVSATKTRIFSIRIFKVNILRLVVVVSEGCIYEIKLVALVLKHISSKHSPTNEIWAPLLRGQSTIAMDIFLWKFSFYQDILSYIHIVCKRHSHTPYRCLNIDGFLGTGLFRINYQ